MERQWKRDSETPMKRSANGSDNEHRNIHWRWPDWSAPPPMKSQGEAVRRGDRRSKKCTKHCGTKEMITPCLIYLHVISLVGAEQQPCRSQQRDDATVAPPVQNRLFVVPAFPWGSFPPSFNYHLTAFLPLPCKNFYDLVLAFHRLCLLFHHLFVVVQPKRWHAGRVDGVGRLFRLPELLLSPLRIFSFVSSRLSSPRFLGAPNGAER